MARITRRKKVSQQTPRLKSPIVVPCPPSSLADACDSRNPNSTVRREDIGHIDARPHLEGASAWSEITRSRILTALALTSFPLWATTAVMLFLIFGGCCSNVFALEAIIQKEPGSGHIITFAQFLLVALEGFVYHFDSTSKKFLKKNHVPIYRWLVQIVLFFSVSLLNNHAFHYSISVPVHIILRSGGSMTTLVVGWFWGKKYSFIQVFSVIILTLGCVISALGDSKGIRKTDPSLLNYITGLTILFVAQVLSAFMGLYIEATYAMYGNHYREGLFYTHALSLILFLPFAKQLKAQFNSLAQSEPLTSGVFRFDTIDNLVCAIPKQILFLAINSITQYVCIRGVNMLGACSTALTVTIVLNIRKLASLLLSIWLFGNALNSQVLFGATVVFAGGFLYGIESQRQKTRAKRTLPKPDSLR